MLQKAIDARTHRNRRASITAALNITAQIIQVATGLISVPLTLNYIGPERFGMWMAISAALAFITFSDFGIGIGMQDRISRLANSNDHKGAQGAFYCAMVLVSAVAICVMVIGCIALAFFDLNEILSIKGQDAKRETELTALTTVAIIALGLIAGLVQRAFSALQEGFWVAILQVLARLTSLGLLFVVVDLRMGLPLLVFVTGGFASCVLLIVGIPLLVYRHKWLVATPSEIMNLVDSSNIKGLMSIGSLGLGASIAIYLVNNSIPIVLATKYSAESVADFAVLFKIIAIPGILLTYILAPLWPAITEACQKEDYEWIRNVYKKSIIGSIALAVVSTVFITGGAKFLISHWAGIPEVVPNTNLIWATTTFMLIGFWNSVCSMILNGLSRFRGQATYGLTIAVATTLIAIIIPAHSAKEYIVWIVSAGFGVRCIFMQVEINLRLTQAAKKQPLRLK